MKWLRHLLVAVLLLLAQSGALTHAIEHLHPDADESASHVDVLCIAAHGLTAPLAAEAQGIPWTPTSVAPPAGDIVAVPFLSAVSSRARAPPLA